MLCEAEHFWILKAQMTIILNWERFKRLGPKLNENGIITVRARLSSWLKDEWNINEFIFILGHP